MIPVSRLGIIAQPVVAAGIDRILVVHGLFQPFGQLPTGRFAGRFFRQRPLFRRFSPAFCGRGGRGFEDVSVYPGQYALPRLFFFMLVNEVYVVLIGQLAIFCGRKPLGRPLPDCAGFLPKKPETYDRKRHERFPSRESAVPA